MSPSSGPVRAARAGVFSAVALGLAVGAHVGAGGQAPGGVGLALGAVVVALVALWLSARRRGRVAVTGALLGVQGALHLLFAALPAPGAPPSAAAHAGHLAHLGHAVHVAAGSPAAPSALESADLVMLGAHLAATLATGAVLAYGEAWCWGAWGLLLRCVAPLWRLVRLTPTGLVAALAPCDDDVRPLAGLRRSSSIGVRGPPVSA